MDIFERSVNQSINKTFIVLIPKMKHASTFNQFRPISLCNFVCKIVSKLMASRLRNLLPKIIFPNQGAFVKGRWIAKNTVIAQELAHKVKNHKGRHGLMLIKVDIKGAYDSLE